ncbi:MAG: RnfABCDGE type electron transport complex subunit D [Firmicutes bacterium]|jgi:electron transport complex protein RnfD|nr:RnfABCDGE type electron transport complex subunit D [Bacillota bacterium]
MAGGGNLVVTVSPHIKSPETTGSIMRLVLLGLLPATLWACVLFGISGIAVIAISVITALFCEVTWHNLRDGKGTGRTWFALVSSLVVPIGVSAAGLGRAAPAAAIALMSAFILSEAGISRQGERRHSFDGSAAVTGLLLALVLPPLVPWWIPFVGAFIAIWLGKEIFGGLGYNVFNPALVARAILVLSWPAHLTAGWFRSLGIDATSKATPLMLAKTGAAADLTAYYAPLLLNNPGGCIGEVSAFLLLVGGAMLLWKRVITWEIPVTYLGAMAVASVLMGVDPVFHLLAGGAVLGAVFMATDYVTSPVSSRGKIVFGIMCGAITMLLRVYSKAPEGVTSAILFMNMVTPLIDRSTMPRPFGVVRAGRGVRK